MAAPFRGAGQAAALRRGCPDRRRCPLLRAKDQRQQKRGARIGGDRRADDGSGVCINVRVRVTVLMIEGVFVCVCVYVCVCVCVCVFVCV